MTAFPNSEGTRFLPFGLYPNCARLFRLTCRYERYLTLQRSPNFTAISKSSSSLKLKRSRMRKRSGLFRTADVSGSIPPKRDLAMEKTLTLSPVKQALLERRLKRASHGAVRSPEIPRRPNRDSAPLSFTQRQMWVIDQMTPGNPAYNLPYGYRLRG